MTKEQLKELIQVFQSCCEYYFETQFQQNRFLYFEQIPQNYFGKEYEVKILDSSYGWLGTPEFLVDTEGDTKVGKFTHECHITYSFQINETLNFNSQFRKVKFYAESLEPIGKIIHPTLICEDVILLDNYRKVNLELKSKFEVLNIDELKYPNDITGFGYFASILRKQRVSIPKNSEVSHGNFYYEIAGCHGEIESCLLSSLFHQKYSSDLTSRKINFEDKDFYMPNLSYCDFQYLLFVGFGFDRLYSFWDRISFLLWSFEPLGLDHGRLSFDNYIKKISNSSLFNKQSKNLIWLKEFHSKWFPKITEYRHRIVHFKITPSWDGVLSSKFANNALHHSFNIDELNTLKYEFEGLGHLLHEHFNFCKEGFLASINLIDELS